MIASALFELGSTSHWMAIIAIFLVGFCFIELGQAYNKSLRNGTRNWLAILCFIFLIFNISASIIDSPNTPLRELLPLHYCSLMLVICPLALWLHSTILRSIAYYGSLVASLQALITPSLDIDYPALSYFSFFAAHGIIIVAALYLPIVLKWKPARWDFIWALIYSNIYLIVIHIVNVCLDTNYGFTQTPPTSGSVLDLLGPWPWYLLTMQIPGALLMILITMPFRHYPKGRIGD